MSCVLKGRGGDRYIVFLGQMTEDVDPEAS